MFGKIVAHKKLLIIATVFIVLTAVTAILLVGPLKNIWSRNDQAPTKTADSLKADAIEAIKTNNNDEAKTLLQEAKTKYDEAGDTDNSVDVQAQLKIIEYEQQQATNPTTTTTEQTDINAPAPVTN